MQVNKRSYSGSTEWRATEWSAGTIMRAACERSKGGGCRSPKDEGGRRLPFTAGLARFFALAWEKARVAIERNEALPKPQWSNAGVFFY